MTLAMLLPGTKGSFMAKKSRSDADRRVRQCERLSRVVRTLQLITGGGRWDLDALATELECSRRTVHRILQTLSLAGVPWFYDPEGKAYRVRSGYRFAAVTHEPSTTAAIESSTLPKLELLDQVIREGEAFQESLGQLLLALKRSRSS